jgi:hypothetical protein
MGDDRIIKLGFDVDQIKNSLDSMDSKLDKVEDKVHQGNIEFKEHIAREAVSDDAIIGELRKMNELWKESNENWREHMQRTRLNEVAVGHLKEINEKSEKRLQIVEDDLKGRKAVIKFFKVIGIIAVAISGSIGAYLAIVNLLHL